MRGGPHRREIFTFRHLTSGGVVHTARTLAWKEFQASCILKSQVQSLVFSKDTAKQLWYLQVGDNESASCSYAYASIAFTARYNIIHQYSESIPNRHWRFSILEPGYSWTRLRRVWNKMGYYQMTDRCILKVANVTDISVSMCTKWERKQNLHARVIRQVAVSKKSNSQEPSLMRFQTRGTS